MFNVFVLFQIVWILTSIEIQSRDGCCARPQATEEVLEIDPLCPQSGLLHSKNVPHCKRTAYKHLARRICLNIASSELAHEGKHLTKAQRVTSAARMWAHRTSGAASGAAPFYFGRAGLNLRALKTSLTEEVNGDEIAYHQLRGKPCS